MNYQEKFSKIIQCKTVSIEGQTIEFKEFLELLKDLFPELFNRCEFKSFDGCYLLIYRGINHNDPIMFMNHHDVVEVSNNWDVDPFGGIVKDNKLYGRGTLDTKGGLYCMLEAANQLAINNYTPKNDIYLLSDNVEETGGLGAKKAAEYFKENNIRFSYILDEGGMITYEPVSGAKGSYAMIGVGEKCCVDVKFTCKSNGGHASTPPKNTGWVKMSKFVSEVERKDLFKIEAIDAILEMLKRLSSSMSGFSKFLLSHSRLFKPLIESIIPKLSPTTNAMFRTTLCFTKGQGGTAHNIIPDEVWINANMRISKHQGIKSSLDEVKKIADKYDIEMEVVDPGEDSIVSSYKSDSFKLLEEAISNIFPDVKSTPYIMSGASDARFFNDVSDNIYRFVPFIVTDKQIKTIHGANENVDVSSLEPAINFYRYLMEK